MLLLTSSGFLISLKPCHIAWRHYSLKFILIKVEHFNIVINIIPVKFVIWHGNDRGVSKCRNIGAVFLLTFCSQHIATETLIENSVVVTRVMCLVLWKM
jgi:hypothetical protein